MLDANLIGLQIDHRSAGHAHGEWLDGFEDYWINVFWQDEFSNYPTIQ